MHLQRAPLPSSFTLALSQHNLSAQQRSPPSEQRLPRKARAVQHLRQVPCREHGPAHVGEHQQPVRRRVFNPEGERRVGRGGAREGERERRRDRRVQAQARGAQRVPDGHVPVHDHRAPDLRGARDHQLLHHRGQRARGHDGAGGVGEVEEVVEGGVRDVEGEDGAGAARLGEGEREAALELRVHLQLRVAAGLSDLRAAGHEHLPVDAQRAERAGLLGDVAEVAGGQEHPRRLRQHQLLRAQPQVVGEPALAGALEHRGADGCALQRALVDKGRGLPPLDGREHRRYAPLVPLHLQPPALLAPLPLHARAPHVPHVVVERAGRPLQPHRVPAGLGERELELEQPHPLCPVGVRGPLQPRPQHRGPAPRQREDTCQRDLTCAREALAQHARHRHRLRELLA
eukprot:3798661-Rhodomonas_salina.1